MQIKLTRWSDDGTPPVVSSLNGKRLSEKQTALLISGTSPSTPARAIQALRLIHPDSRVSLLLKPCRSEQAPYPKGRTQKRYTKQNLEAVHSVPLHHAVFN